MAEKEYIVTLKKGVNADEFNSEMTASSGSGNIPNRTVDVANARTKSIRNTHYGLEDSEALDLKNDPRVEDVEVPPDQIPNAVIGHDATRTGTYNKTTSASGTYQNWGLIRCQNETNNYSTGTTTSDNYNFTADGTGVDFIVQDSGIQTDHPEFQDSGGSNRWSTVDWYTASGVSGSQNANHDRDYDGHGTHCAGIAVGKTFGHAQGAKIYGQKLSGLEGTGDSGTGISITDAFDCIKGWHNAKSGANAGRPTVVNMSWGYNTSHNDLPSALNYRGSVKTGTDIDTQAKLQSFGFTTYQPSGVYKTPLRVASVDADIDEMIDAGIHICHSAGNNYYVHDLTTGSDYNNTYTIGAGTGYYNRGSSPYSVNAFNVGNIDSTAYSSTQDQKAESSTNGPAVDIYSPGTYIMSATSTTNKFSAPNYYANSSYKQTNISGTSMSGPQVAGVLCLLLSVNPQLTPAEIKTLIHSLCTTDKIYDPADGNLANWRNLNPGSTPKRFLFNPYTGANVLTITT